MRSAEPVAYVIGRYPAVSHAFVTREVQAVRAAGTEVETISVHRAPDDEVLSALDRAERERTYALLPVRWGTLLRTHLRALSRPGAYLRTLAGALRDGPPGLRGRTWQLFYFVEAILVWDRCRRRGVRHLHAHHLNQAADAAMLAVRYANDRGDDGRWTWSFTMHGPNELYDVSHYRLAQKAGEADAVACIGDFARSQVMAFTPEERWPRFTVVRCGVDPTEFDPGPVVPEAAAADAAGRLNVLCVGRLVPFKGQGILLEAVAALRARGIEATVTLVGEGPARAPLEASATRLGLGDAARFAGAVGQDEIRDLYRAADAFCLPSFAEGIPVVLMEAMALRVPVVTTRVMGIGELVEDEVSGLLVAPGRADAVTAALTRLAADPALRARLGAAGRARVEAEFDVRESGRRLRTVFEMAAGS